MVRAILRNFIAGATASILNIYVLPIVSRYVQLPYLIAQPVMMGILVVIVALILQKIGL